MQDYFEIGQIVNTSGLKGVVKANLFTDDITKIEVFEKVLIEKNKKLTEYEVEEVKYHKNQALIKFRGIDDIDKAEALRNCLIKVRREDEPELPEDTYFIVDLIGLDVFLDTGEKLGILKEVFPVQSGNHDVYVVETGEKDVLLPAIGDVIKDIDMHNRKMVVHLLEGLIWKYCLCFRIMKKEKWYEIWCFDIVSRNVWATKTKHYKKSNWEWNY